MNNNTHYVETPETANGHRHHHGLGGTTGPTATNPVTGNTTGAGTGVGTTGTAAGNGFNPLTSPHTRGAPANKPARKSGGGMGTALPALGALTVFGAGIMLASWWIALINGLHGSDAIKTKRIFAIVSAVMFPISILGILCTGGAARAALSRGHDSGDGHHGDGHHDHRNRRARNLSRLLVGATWVFMTTALFQHVVTICDINDSSTLGNWIFILVVWWLAALCAAFEAYINTSWGHDDHDSRYGGANYGVNQHPSHGFGHRNNYDYQQAPAAGYQNPPIGA